MKKLWGLGVVALVLAGCTAAPAQPAGLGEVESVADLRAAFMDAGGECAGWTLRANAGNASESGDCSASTVLAVYVTDADLKNTVEGQREFRVPGTQLTLLVGPNWIINSPEAEGMVDMLGGEWITE